MLKIKIKDTVPGKAGPYYFFLFYLSSKAIVDTDEIIAAVLDSDGIEDEDLSSNFLKLINKNVFEETPMSEIEFDLELYQRLKTKALEFMSELRKRKEETTRQRNDSLIAIRRDALEKTYEVKKRRAQYRLENAIDIRIIRMHEGEIKNLDSKLDKLLSELEDKRNVSVSYEPIACGLIEL